MSTPKKEGNKFQFMSSDFTSSSSGNESTPQQDAKESSKAEKAEQLDSRKTSREEEKREEREQPLVKNSQRKRKNQEKLKAKSKMVREVSSVKIVSQEQGNNLGKRSDPNYKTVGVLIPQKAHKKAKILLMDDERGRDFSDLVTQLLEKWLEKPDV